MPSGFAEEGSFSSRVAPADEADYHDQGEAELDKNLAAIEPINWGALQRGIGEKAMKEKSGRREINAEMKRLPKMAAQPKAKIRSDHHEGEEIESDGADRVFEWLAGRVNRVDEVQ